MARIRTIKPQFWEDEKLSSIPIQARLLFIGTWTISDDAGVLKGNEKFIKAQIFPYDDALRLDALKSWIDALVKARMLVPLTYKGESYLYIRTFHSHQKIDKPSLMRNIPDEDLKKLLDEYSANNQEPLDIVNGIVVVNGKDEERSILSPAIAEAKHPDFEKFEKWIEVNASNVGKLGEPFTEKQFLKLKKQYGVGIMQDMLLRMHNWKDLRKKNTSAYLTFLNWVKKEKSTHIKEMVQ